MAPLLASLNVSLSKMEESWRRLNHVTVTHAEALPLSLSLASQLKQPHQHRSHAAHQSQPPQHLSLYEPVGLQLARAAGNPKPHSRTGVAGQQRARAAVPMGAGPHPAKGRALLTLSHGGPLASQPFAPKAALGHGHQGRSASRPASAAPADAERRRLPRVGSAPASRQGAGAACMRPVNLAGIGPGRVAIYEL